MTLSGAGVAEEKTASVNEKWFGVWVKRVHFSTSPGWKTFRRAVEVVALNIYFPSGKFDNWRQKRSLRVIYFTKCSRSFVTWLRGSPSFVRENLWSLGTCNSRMPRTTRKAMDHDARRENSRALLVEKARWNEGEGWSSAYDKRRRCFNGLLLKSISRTCSVERQISPDKQFIQCKHSVSVVGMATVLRVWIFIYWSLHYCAFASSKPNHRTVPFKNL